MKTFIKSLRLINMGFLLGVAFTCWVLGDDDKKNTDSGEDNLSNLDIYNKYNNMSARDKFEAYKENRNA